MKIVSSGSLQLSGPLSRNDRIRHMSVGDSVSVRILERTGRDSAVIDLLGNKVNARFTAGVPREDRLILVMNEIRNGTLEFSLREDTPVKSGTNLIAQIFLREKELTPEKTRAFLTLLKSRTPGVFSLAALFSSGTRIPRTDDVRRVLDMLRKSGFPKEKMFIAGGVLSGLSDGEIGHLVEILNPDGLLQPKNKAEIAHDRVYIADAASILTEDKDFLVQWEDDEGRSEVECIGTPEFYAGRIETPRLGLVEFVIRKEKDISVTIVCDEKTHVIFSERLMELRDTLERYYADPSIVCLPRSEWDEKVLAFAENAHKRALDVSV